MAQTTKDIRRRINSIGNIMQITNAMELVSSAKLRKARKTLETTRPYYTTVFNNINEIISYSRFHTSPLIETRQVKKRAILVVSSNRGLAGGYNINVSKKAIDYIKENQGPETVIYTTGLRSIDTLKKSGCEINTDFAYIGEEPTAEDAVAISSHLVDKYLEKEYDEIILAYTRFETVLSLVPTVVRLLPATGFERNKEEKNVDIIYEPSATGVLNQMVRQYINVTILGCLIESSASEQASRRTAMENATSNGEELLEDLELVYNRVRQASITQEITEIVGGAEALK